MGEVDCEGAFQYKSYSKKAARGASPPSLTYEDDGGEVLNFYFPRSNSKITPVCYKFTDNSVIDPKITQYKSDF